MRKLASTLTLITILLTSAMSDAWAEEVLVKGSDTLLNLVQQLSEAYMDSHAGTTISVVGGGSGVGIAALIDGNVNIANASRKIKDKEVKKANDNGIKPVEIVIAIDGLAVITNPGNSTNELTVEQLGAIYRGEIKNWKEVGGPDMKINLYGRQPSSGTFVFFREFVLKGEYSPRMRQMTGNAQIVDAVKHDKSAIGYVGLGYVKGAKGIKVLGIGERKKDGQIKYVSPLVFITPLKPGQKKPEPTDYPLTRPLFQYTNGTPAGIASDFIGFELSGGGQEIVEEVGFLKLSEKQLVENLQIIGGSH
jgi:phosphate transport system substrate-binding protein